MYLYLGIWWVTLSGHVSGEDILIHFFVYIFFCTKQFLKQDLIQYIMQSFWWKHVVLEWLVNKKLYKHVIIYFYAFLTHVIPISLVITSISSHTLYKYFQILFSIIQMLYVLGKRLHAFLCILNMKYIMLTN